MITFQKELLADVAAEVQPLLEQHYVELARNRDVVKLNPDWARYQVMELTGALIVFTARDNGRLIGYSAFTTYKHPHYQDLQMVSNDVLFLRKDYRRVQGWMGRLGSLFGLLPRKLMEQSSTGLSFLTFCETQIQSLYPGDFCLTWHAKERTALASILPRLSYGVQDIVFSKLFKGD